MAKQAARATAQQLQRKQMICHHLKKAMTMIEGMENPDDSLILATLDAQDEVLELLNNGRLPGFLVRRALPRIQRTAVH